MQENWEEQMEKSCTVIKFVDFVKEYTVDVSQLTSHFRLGMGPYVFFQDITRFFKILQKHLSGKNYKTNKLPSPMDLMEYILSFWRQLPLSFPAI